MEKQITFKKFNEDLSRISALHGNPYAMLIYMYMYDLLQLSKKSGDAYKDKNGKYFILFTPQMAESKMGCKKNKFFEMKKLLKDAGLIYFNTQKTKSSGVSTPIYVNENISHLCDMAELTYEAPKTSITDDITTEEVVVDTTTEEPVKLTTIQTGVIGDMLAKFKALEEKIQALETENVEIKAKVKALKETQSVHHVAIEETVVNEVINNSNCVPKIETKSTGFNPMDFGNGIDMFDMIPTPKEEEVINILNIAPNPPSDNLVVVEELIDETIIVEEEQTKEQTEQAPVVFGDPNYLKNLDNKIDKQVEEWEKPKKPRKPRKPKLTLEETKIMNQGRCFEYDGKWYGSNGEEIQAWSNKAVNINEI